MVMMTMIVRPMAIKMTDTCNDDDDDDDGDDSIMTIMMMPVTI